MNMTRYATTRKAVRNDVAHASLLRRGLAAARCVHSREAGGRGEGLLHGRPRPADTGNVARATDARCELREMRGGEMSCVWNYCADGDPLYYAMAAESERVGDKALFTMDIRPAWFAWREHAEHCESCGVGK